MKTDNRNLAQNCDSELKIYSGLDFKHCISVFSFLFLTFCCLPSDARTETSPEQLDPTDLLMSYLVAMPQDQNTPSVPRQVTEVQQPIRLEPPKSNIGVFGKVADNARVDLTAQVDQNSPQSNLDIAEDSNSHQDSNLSEQGPERISFAGLMQSAAQNLQKRQLWRALISPPASKRDEKHEDELHQLIRQIYSIEFEAPAEDRELIVVVEPITTPEHPENETSTDVDTVTPEELREKAIAPKLPYEPVTDQTLQMLKNLLLHPDQLDNPFELGEVLFLSGLLQEAAISYKEALNRKGPNQPDLAQHRAWILLQIGNCLRNDDLPAATKAYRQLITEYPDSPWSDLAKAQYKLIEWYLEDKPQTLTTEDTFSDSLIEDGAPKSD